MPPVSKLQAKLDARHAKDQKRVATTKKKLYGKVMQKKKSLGKFYMNRSDLVPKLTKTQKNHFIKRKADSRIAKNSPKTEKATDRKSVV